VGEDVLDHLNQYGLSGAYVNALTEAPDGRVRTAYGPERTGSG
jgi:hypothetical protein